MSSWFGGISKTLKQKLQVAQNKVVRFILDLKPRDSITCDILDSLKMLRVENRVKQLCLNHVHNIFYGCAPSYLNSHFSLNENCTSGSSSSNFKLPRIGGGGSESGSFYYNAILDWNALVKGLRNKDAFKAAVKTHLRTAARNVEGEIYVYF